MKKTAILLILLALLAIIGWKGSTLVSSYFKKPETSQTLPSSEEWKGNTVVGNIWDNEVSSSPTPLPQPTGNKQVTLTPPKQEAPVSTPAEEIQEEWPLPTTTPSEQVQTSVTVGAPVKEIPQNAEELQPLPEKLEEQAPKAETIDPRKAEELLGTTKDARKWEDLTDEEKMEEEYEPTNISVQRTFLATLPNGEKQPIRVKVPVVYKSRTLRLNEPNRKRAQELITRSRALEQKLADAKKEAEAILKEWNDVVRTSTPGTALFPESPSLPENQSAGELNRPKTDPALLPGKNATMEITQP